MIIPSGAETNAAYHASGAWGSSRINDARLSPQIAYLRLIGQLPQERTRSLVIGSALHARFDQTYDDEFATGPAVSSRSTKAWRDAESEQSRTLLLPSEVQLVAAMETSVRENAYADVMLDGAEHEVGVRRAAPGERYQLQCRMDIYRPGVLIADIKTTANLDEFEKSVVKYGYHRQAAFYQWLCAEETGMVVPFSFIVVEKQAPYRSRVIDIDPDYLAIGWAEVSETLTRIDACYQTGNWRDSQHQVVSPPSWMRLSVAA